MPAAAGMKPSGVPWASAKSRSCEYWAEAPSSNAALSSQYSYASSSYPTSSPCRHSVNSSPSCMFCPFVINAILIVLLVFLSSWYGYSSCYHVA